MAGLYLTSTLHPSMLTNRAFDSCHVVTLTTSSNSLARVNKNFIVWDFSPVRLSHSTGCEPARQDFTLTSKHRSYILSTGLRRDLLSRVNAALHFRMTLHIAQLDINEHCRLVTYDIKDLYVNIPIEETLYITDFFLRIKNNKATIRSQILELMHTTLKQNYFKFGQEFYRPQKGIAMGLPLSSLVAEILQFFELRVVKHNLETKSIIIYTRYLDDILILYDESRTNVDTLTRALNNIHNNLPSVPSHEREGQVNFLDLWIIRNNTTLEIDIFRGHIQH
ncbi:hypothetical protein Cfor_02920 [Coptotermes formosanus]|uniref:Reverse transcriptase domain-containing protein n=1 Tax=Coptotermes formosanus TaxID=36987 RepID=A0A6L2PTL3_COPFO|nr:hypothetical protein Cfor_02920 [Coptotermes formosanus]